MILLGDEAGARVRDADDLRSFKVVLRGVDLAGAVETLTADGYAPEIEDDRLWLSAGRVRSELVAARQGAFDAMIGYARTRGFASSDGARLRAHYETEGSGN